MIAKGKLQTSGSGKNNYASVGGLFDAYATKSDLKNIELYLFLEQLSLSLFVRGTASRQLSPFLIQNDDLKITQSEYFCRVRARSAL